MTKVRVPVIWQSVSQMSCTDLPFTRRPLTSRTSSPEQQESEKLDGPK
jgi:hypothetical protein